MKTYLNLQSLITVIAVSIAVFVLVENARADQGNMHHALDALRNARYDLNEARGAKGGHREEALRLVNQAIDEVKAGIRVGEENE